MLNHVFSVRHPTMCAAFLHNVPHFGAAATHVFSTCISDLPVTLCAAFPSALRRCACERLFFNQKPMVWGQRSCAYFLSKTQCLERRRFEVFLLSSSSFSSLLLFLLGAATRWTSVCVRHHHVDHFCHYLQWPECNVGRTYSICGGTTVAPP